MVERARHRTNGHQPEASPGRKPTAREIARFERFIAERKPALDAMSSEELDAIFEDAMKQIDKEQFLREAEALREQMKERQAARVPSRPKRNSAKRN